MEINGRPATFSDYWSFGVVSFIVITGILCIIDFKVGMAIMIAVVLFLFLVAMPLALVFRVFRFFGRTDRLVKKKLDE